MDSGARSPIVVVGVGAIGGTTAGALLRAGREVVLVDPWYENVETIRRHGLALTVDGERHEVRAQALYPDELSRMPARPAVALLACKSYDTELLVRAVEPHLAADGFIVSLQNGINEDLIAALIGARRTIGCVVHYNGGMLEPAHAIRFSPAAWHSYTVGELDGAASERLQSVVALLSDAGHTASTTDIFGTLWAKLVINCMVNGLTAAAGLTTPALFGSSSGQAVMIELAIEAAGVARAQGRPVRPIHLVGSAAELPDELLLAAADDPAAYEQVHALIRGEAAARAAAVPRAQGSASSMLQDIRKRRRPEIDYMNGYVVREGRRLGVETPTNEAVVELLRSVSSGARPQDRSYVEQLAEMVGAPSPS
jgi:2-dehydropantoate 2-reductase